MPTAGFPWSHSGTNSSGGAVSKAAAVPISSGASAPTRSRQVPITSAARSDHAEVAAAAAERPEELLVLALARRQQPAVRRDDVGRDEVVAGEPVLRRDPPVAAGRALPDVQCTCIDSALMEQAWLDELSEFLRIPSVSADPMQEAHVRQAGEWVRDFVRRAGGEAELRETESQPLVIGEIPASAGNGA